MSRTPQEIVEDLSPAYTTWKAEEKKKNKLKDEFFDAITRHLAENETQAEDLLYIEANSPEEAQEYARKLRPGWLIDDWRDHPTEPGAYEIIVVEDPQFQPYTIEYDGKVWGRQVVSGSTFVDDELLLVKDPDLWMEVSSFPNEEFLFALFEDDDEALDQEKLEHFELVGEKFGITRSLKPLKDLEPEQLSKLQPYIFEGKPTVKLPAPKKAES